MNLNYTYQVFTLLANRFPYRPYPISPVSSPTNLPSIATKIINFTNYNPIVEVGGCNTTLVVSTNDTGTFTVSASNIPVGWTFANNATGATTITPSSTSNVTVKICAPSDATAGVYSLILITNLPSSSDTIFVKAIMNVTVTKPVVFSTANSDAATTTTSAAGGCS